MLSFDFDASLSDIGAALWAGAALVCVPAKRWLSGRQFFKDSAQWKITHIDAPPAWLSLISHLDPPSSLQTIIAGGEVTPPVLLKRWGDRVNWCNVYGPTESTVCTSMERRNSKDVSQTIGQPMKEVVYALKTEKGLRLLPSSGEKGELYIYCQGNGFYWNDEEKNQTRFEYLEDKKFFKTRDLVEKTDNNWLFIGRMDRIVKQHGVFVDLDLVERDVLQKKGVTSAACVQTQGAVTVFYTGTCPERDIVKMFSGIRVCKKEKLPVKNSKIDKKSLEKDAGGV